MCLIDTRNSKAKLSKDKYKDQYKLLGYKVQHTSAPKSVTISMIKYAHKYIQYYQFKYD